MERNVLVIDGWACRYRVLNDGRRQIIDFVLPGDFAMNPIYEGEAAPYSVASLTDVNTVSVDEAARFHGAHSILTALADKAVLRDRVRAEEWSVSLGRRTAYERVCHLVMELYFRLSAVGHVSGSSFYFPPTQETIGDAVGLSCVHVNRVLKQLRGAGALQLSNRRLEITDLQEISNIADMSESYFRIVRGERMQC